MKYLLVFLLFLSGCSTTVPVVMKFPSVPPELTETCPDLDKTPEGTTQLSKTLEVVVKNYSKYHQCRSKVEAWNEWYTEQKKVFDSVK